MYRGGIGYGGIKGYNARYNNGGYTYRRNTYGCNKYVEKRNGITNWSYHFCLEILIRKSMPRMVRKSWILVLYLWYIGRRQDSFNHRVFHFFVPWMVDTHSWICMEKWLTTNHILGIVEGCFKNKFRVHEYEEERTTNGDSCTFLSDESIKEEEEVEVERIKKFKKRV